MAQSAKLPAHQHPTEVQNSPQAAASLLTQCLEDHRVAERVERALRATGFAALGTVRVSVSARFVILRGRVSRFYLKQLAQAIALAIPGARQIRNELEVVQPKCDYQEACAVRQPLGKLRDPPNRQSSKD